MTARPPSATAPRGLCESCILAEVTGNARGSTFVLCALSRKDDSFPRYPRLPVMECRGYAAAETPPDEAHE